MTRGVTVQRPLDEVVASYHRQREDERRKKMTANSSGMAVAVTLVFSDESHREAWLKRVGVLSTDERRDDYERRAGNANLYFTVASEPPSQESSE